MASEILDDALEYGELGVHRHLVVSERLRTRRRMLNLTQKEVVARLRRLGVATTNKSLSGLEHGAGLDVGKLPELARALDCTLTYLVGLTDDPGRWEPDSVRWPRERPAADSLRETATGSSRAPEQERTQECPAILGPYYPTRRRR